MPELPDVVLYLERLESLLGGKLLERVRLGSPFLLRTVEPPLSEAEGRRLAEVRRIGKRIVLGLDAGPDAERRPDHLFLVVHLMIAGRLRWRKAGATLPKRRGLLALDFENGTLLLTEEGSKKRASLHVVADEDGLEAMDRGGLELLEADEAAFEEAVGRENRTLKRFLTDPRLVSGVGNAYSDEILHRARLSPFKRTSGLTADERAALFAAACEVLTEWVERLRRETEGFPEKVTAFRPEMAVHGRYREPCPVCGAPVQRVVYAENEANYCPGCQTGGKVMADRALSRLLHDDWPRSLDELERRGLGAR